jgi:acetylornithine/succinyldiaminopimelate/putrescine aminotransferase
MWGIELDRPAAPVARALLDLGFVVGTAREKVLRLLPPYVVPKKALIEFMNALGVILSEAKDLPSGIGEGPSPSTRLRMTLGHKEKAA